MPTIATRQIQYQHDDVPLHGALTFDEDRAGDGSRPAVLVFHGMEGRSDAQVDFARSLTEWGYLGFAVDLFGIDAETDGLEGCGALMDAFMQDRTALRERLLHVLAVVKSLPEVDENRVAAIGFCFGGLCVLDLARTGTVRGVASFHGVLGAPDDAPHGVISSKAIVFHGWDDPFAPPGDVVELGRKLSVRNADWQIHAYGNTVHSFMARTAANPDAGIEYNEVSARRAWESLRTFLRDALA